MNQLKEKFLVDDEGHRVAVLLDFADYKHIMDDLEELESIRAYDESKKSAEKSIPLDEAFAEIEKNR